MRFVIVFYFLVLSACGLGDPSFYLGETEVYNYTNHGNDELYVDLHEAWEEMQKTTAPKFVFKTTILIWPYETDALSEDKAAIYTNWENEIEMRNAHRGGPLWYSSLPHELAHRWNCKRCDGDCSSHGEEFQKKFRELRNAARRTKWAALCWKEGYDRKYFDICYPDTNND